jgi:hypothetical protein
MGFRTGLVACYLLILHFSICSSEMQQQCKTGLQAVEKSLILVTGGTGLVGNAIREISLENDMGFKWIFANSSTLDLLADYNQVRAYFEAHRPKYVVHLAAKVFRGENNVCRADTIGRWSVS